MGIKEVKQYFVTEDPSKVVQEQFNRRGRKINSGEPMVYMISSTAEDFKPEMKKPLNIQEVKTLNEYVAKLSAEEKKALKQPKYFYEVEFDKPGGMMMPVIVELQFEDGTTENHHFPVQIWRKGNDTAKRVFATEKPVKKIQLDPKLETADIDVTNNVWPKEEVKSKFDELSQNK
jgi:hypothetical protein